MFLMTDIDKMGIYLYFVVNQSENMHAFDHAIFKKKTIIYFLDKCGLDTFKLINFIFLSKKCTSCKSCMYYLCKSIKSYYYIIAIINWKSIRTYQKDNCLHCKVENSCSSDVEQNPNEYPVLIIISWIFSIDIRFLNFYSFILHRCTCTSIVLLHSCLRYLFWRMLFLHETSKQAVYYLIYLYIIYVLFIH